MQTLTKPASDTTHLEAADRLIVALDCPTPGEARALVSILGQKVTFYKIGWRLFLTGGMDFVNEVLGQGKRVFLDLKMDDIPETIETAVAVLRGKVQLLTLMGGDATIRAAVRGRGDATEPRLLSVTYLSSLDEADLRKMLPQGAPVGSDEILPGFIARRGRMAIEAGADGLIASGDSVRQLRAELGPRPLIVTPGIRPAKAGPDDQKRTKTPAEAIAEGSDMLVVGRPIWAATDPVAAAELMIRDINAGLEARPANPSY